MSARGASLESDKERDRDAREHLRLWSIEGPAEQPEPLDSTVAVYAKEPGKLTVSAFARGFEATVEIDVTPAP